MGRGGTFSGGPPSPASNKLEVVFPPHKNRATQFLEVRIINAGFRVAACGPRIEYGAGLPGMTNGAGPRARVMPAKAGIQCSGPFMIRPLVTLFVELSLAFSSLFSTS